MCKRSRSFYIFSAVTYFNSYFRSKKNQFAVLYFFLGVYLMLFVICNPLPNILGKIEKSNELDNAGKTLYLFLHIFLAQVPQICFCRGDGTLGYVPMQFCGFADIFLFPKTHKFFGNSWVNSYTRFFILNIRFRFTFNSPRIVRKFFFC